MKGLAMNEMGKPEEAMELVKLGIRNDMRCEQLAAHAPGVWVRAGLFLMVDVPCFCCAFVLCNVSCVRPRTGAMSRGMCWASCTVLAASTRRQ